MGNEYTVSCSRHGNIVWHGSDSSDYNYYRNRDCSDRCSSCQSEKAAEDAQRKADQRRRDEEARVRRRAAELERLERERQEKRERERRRQRIIEQQALANQRKTEADEREAKRKKMEDALKQKADELEKEAEKLQKLKLQTNDPFLQYKKMHTLQAMKEIGKEVSEVAVVGEIIKERVSEISKDLQDSLGDDYKLIEKEMDRYKKYGKEMTDMTNVFKTELGKAFKALAPDTAADCGKLHNEANEYNELIDNENDEDDKKYYQNKKQNKKDAIKNKLKVVDNAMKAIQFKLNIMESYYEQMTEDYNYFEKFVNTKEDELSEVITYFQSVAAQLKKSPDRSKLFVSKTSDLYDEYYSKPQILEFKEDYEYKETNVAKTGIKMGEAIHYGAKAGLVLGGLSGGCSGGPLGALGGAVGGAIIGAGIGAIVGACNKPSCEVTHTMKTGSVTVTSELISYKNKEHAEALQKIVQNIQNSKTYKKMKNELTESKNLAKKRRNELRQLKSNMMKVQQPLLNYKVEMNKLKTVLDKGNNMTDDDAKMIDKKLQKLSAEMQLFIQTMT